MTFASLEEWCISKNKKPTVLRFCQILSYRLFYQPLYRLIIDIPYKIKTHECVNNILLYTEHIVNWDISNIMSAMNGTGLYLSFKQNTPLMLVLLNIFVTICVMESGIIYAMEGHLLHFFKSKVHTKSYAEYPIGVISGIGNHLYGCGKNDVSYRGFLFVLFNLLLRYIPSFIQNTPFMLEKYRWWPLRWRAV